MLSSSLDHGSKLRGLSPKSSRVVEQCDVNIHSLHSAAVQFPRPWHHSKWRRRWMGFKGSRRNRRRDPKYPSARRLRRVREYTGAPSEGATCAWMAVNEAVGCRVHFLRCGGLLDDWSVEGVLSLIFM
ncbi:uncharacterized protein TNCV_1587801 [Trichonephila clavipes]|uniref:Uncharacterized protein n=1 Tax=Trichonephila clavipes TaxID=2585209 RepID=A0A8X6V3W1_TRICX|nr:uncharacterized protein TNCV_1587801 [Trichonephila clavipes]